jgi:DNA (cytosine-5)-methyltransferase 1
MEDNRPTWYEFFAGGGMARLGLGEGWNCAFSNEWSERKAETYRQMFGDAGLRVCDVAQLKPQALPGLATLAWASFPCQDLSLAGNGAGLSGARSGTFKPFWELMLGLLRLRHQPQIIVLENVVGTLTSHKGRDFESIVSALSQAKYRVGALVIDAVRFLPQSRPRLFVIGVFEDSPVPRHLTQEAPSELWHPRSLRTAVAAFPANLRRNWVWWNLPAPTQRVRSFEELLESRPSGVKWHTDIQTDHILSLMSPLHREKISDAQRVGQRIVGTIYRRTRPDERGKRVQRAEVRFDQISGCLRTPVGGSSRQTIIVVEGRRIRTRLLSPREAARLMGVPEHYPLPGNYNDAYHLFGDGVAVPVVGWLNTHLLYPIAMRTMMAAA